jgi:hypothetical protein
MFGTKGLIAYFMHIFMKYPFLALILAIFTITYVTVPQFEQELSSQYNIRVEQLDYSLSIVQNAYQPYEKSLIEWSKESCDRIVQMSIDGYVLSKAWLLEQSVVQDMLAYANSFHAQQLLLAEKTILREEGRQEAPEKYYLIRNKVVEELNSDKNAERESTGVYLSTKEDLSERVVPSAGDDVLQATEKSSNSEKEIAAQLDPPTRSHAEERADSPKKEGLTTVQTFLPRDYYAIKMARYSERDSENLILAYDSQYEYVIASVSDQEWSGTDLVKHHWSRRSDSEEKEKTEITIQFQKLLVKKPMTKKEREREEAEIQLAQLLAKKYMTQMEREEVSMQLRQLVAKKQSKSDTGIQYPDMR